MPSSDEKTLSATIRKMHSVEEADSAADEYINNTVCVNADDSTSDNEPAPTRLRMSDAADDNEPAPTKLHTDDSAADEYINNTVCVNADNEPAPTRLRMSDANYDIDWSSVLSDNTVVEDKNNCECMRSYVQIIGLIVLGAALATLLTK